MSFVDEAKIFLTAGQGGKGCLGFRREKYIPKGGPNGGDGGDGGSIFLQTDFNINTLFEFKYKKHFKAQNGFQGEGKNKKGKKGDDIVIKVPVGTLIVDSITNQLITDLDQQDKKILIAQGGEGGLGNARFKSSTNQAPRKITLGKDGEVREVKLVLKLLADVGCFGYPNAGKSSLVASITNSNTKIGNYPFSTLHPVLGILEDMMGNKILIADIPGLIEGSSKGKGLGDKFLKHIARNKLLLHVIDCSQNISNIEHTYHMLINELASFHPLLLKKNIWLIFNKVDLIDGEDEITKKIQKILYLINRKNEKYFIISCVNKFGLENLKQELINYFNETLKEFPSDKIIKDREITEQLVKELI